MTIAPDTIAACLNDIEDNANGIFPCTEDFRIDNHILIEAIEEEFDGLHLNMIGPEARKLAVSWGVGKLADVAKRANWLRQRIQAIRTNR